MCGCWCPLASTADAGVSGKGGLSPVLAQRDTAMIVEHLRLDPHIAAPVVAALLTDYETQWTQAREHLHAALVADGGSDLRLANADRLSAFQSTQSALAAVLADDIATLLDDDGRQRWIRLQHDLWRLRRLRYGQFHGESIDLRLLVDELSTTLASLQSPAVEAIVLTWQTALADLLAAREPFDSAGSSRYRALLLDRQYEAALVWMTQWVNLRTAIRDLNLDTAKRIEALLDDTDADAFASDIAQRIAIHTSGGRLVDRVATQVAKDRSLPESIRNRVADIHAAYQRDTATLNVDRERMEHAIEPLAVLAPMQRKLNMDAVYVQLVEARQYNELDLQMHAQRTVDAICDLIGDALCMSLARGSRDSGAIDRTVHPSGLPLDDRKLRDTPRQPPQWPEPPETPPPPLELPPGPDPEDLPDPFPLPEPP